LAEFDLVNEQHIVVLGTGKEVVDMRQLIQR